MTKEDYEFGVKYQDLMRTIITNKAASYIPIEYVEFLQSRKYTTCKCNAGVFTGTSRFFNDWLAAGEETKNGRGLRQK